MDTNKLNFNEGDRVIHHHGIRGEFLDEALVVKVHKNGNFKIDKSGFQFRQTGWEAAEDGTWGQEWVEPWSPHRGEALTRHKLEIRVMQAANTLIQSIQDVSIERLEFIASWIEHVNRKASGE